MADVIEFYASSGSPCHPRQIVPLVITSGQGYNRIGFFGAGGPSTFILVNNPQDTTYIVNEDGSPSGAWTASGKLSNNKYVTSSNVNPNSSGSIAVSALTLLDSTVRVRFTEPSGLAAQLQNATFKVVSFNASSGVDSQSAMVSGILVYAFEVGQASAWTLLTQTGVSNSLSLTSRATSGIIHDYHLAVSATPLAVGVKSNFGFLVSLEYL